MKKILSILLASAALTLSAIAQAANDGFLVPLDEDLTNAITAAPAGTGGGVLPPVPLLRWAFGLRRQVQIKQ